MPATAGRIRMPANNRVHSSAALQTHGIWQSAIGYDPYAPTDARDKSRRGSGDSAANAYDSFQGLLALARVTSVSNPAETRGACKKCGRIGHLTYQCRNFLSLKVATAGDDFAEPPQNDDSVPRVDKKAEESDEEEEEDESLSSDSDSSVDEEMEKIIAERFGKKMSGKAGSLSVRSKKESNSSDDEEEKMKDRKHRRRRNHHRRHRSRKDSDSDSDSVRGLKHKRRRRRERDYDSSSDRKTKKRRRHRERRSVLSSESESTASSLDEDDERRVRKEKKRSRKR